MQASNSNSAAPIAPSTGPRRLDGLLYDPTVLIEGLGSLLLPPVASGGHDEVPAEDVLPAPSLLQDSLGFGEDVDHGKLAPRLLLASSKDVVSRSVRDTTDVRHVEEAPTEPCGGLSPLSHPRAIVIASEGRPQTQSRLQPLGSWEMLPVPWA
jgi:hypothetical protein